MSAPLIIEAPAPEQERLARKLEQFAYGFQSADCIDCREAAASHCGPCGDDLADKDALEEAATAVRKALSAEAAKRLFTETVAKVAGLSWPGSSSGRFASVRGPEPIYAAVVAARSEQRSAQNEAA